MSNLFTELKRRNVFKVATVYAVVSWLILQVLNSVVPIIEAPEWVSKVILIMLVAGFPIALLFAWAFEMTPEGVKQTDSKLARPYGLAVLTAGLLAAGAWYYFGAAPTTESAPAAQLEALSTPALPTAEDKSIAVLPFVDMSAAGDQEYLGDGITEEILNVLVRSRDLRVVGRTSSFAFKGKNQDLRAIGEALGVAYILEGSVRKAGERVRVTAQLVKASDGFHLWSETYDRTLSDIFALQDEIAASISTALETSLDFGGANLSASRTTNAQANELYLQGLAALKARGDSVAYATLLFRAATDLDPDFAAAWSSLGFAYNQMNFPDALRTETLSAYRDDLIEEYIEKALTLNPHDTTAHHLKANLHRKKKEWTEAEAEYLLALDASPQSAAIYEDYAEFLQNVGRLADALEAGRKSYEYDPLTPLYISAYADVLMTMGRYEEAAAYYDLAMQQDDEYWFGPWAILHSRLMQGRYGEALNLISDPLSSRYRLRGFFRALIDYGEGKVKMLPKNTSFNPENTSTNRWLISYENEASAIVLVNLDQLNVAWDKIFSSRGNNIKDSVLTQFFSVLWGRPDFHDYVAKEGLVAYWRESGKWGDMCRPLGDDDFECGASE